MDIYIYNFCDALDISWRHSCRDARVPNEQPQDSSVLATVVHDSLSEVVVNPIWQSQHVSPHRSQTSQTSAKHNLFSVILWRNRVSPWGLLHKAHIFVLRSYLALSERDPQIRQEWGHWIFGTVCTGPTYLNTRVLHWSLQNTPVNKTLRYSLRTLANVCPDLSGFSLK